MAYDNYREPPTIRHRLGLAIGRSIDRWMVRGYHYGNFRNALSTGLHERLRSADTCYARSSCPGRRDDRKRPSAEM